jgi:phosphatidylglycerophosphate synthase
MNEETPIENRRPLKTRSHAWVHSLAETVVARGITPNQISVAGIGVALLGFVFLWGAGRWPAGWVFLIPAAICIQVRLLCNMLDGVVAVEGGKKEKGGELFNEVPDRVEDTLFFAGAGYACGYLQLGWLCAVLAIFTAYIRALGASFGQAQDFGGPCAKPQRMFLLTVALPIATVLGAMNINFNVIAWMLGAIAVGTAITALLRLRRIYGQMP